jgi:uncharacterized protein (DUF1330 family)
MSEETKSTPKGYWIARVDADENSSARYKDYVDMASVAFQEYGAKFLARGGDTDHAEGDCRARNVIIEFESLATAKACFYSEQYQKAALIRREVSTGEVVLVEGAQ